jgi:subtilisin family serine protease
MSGPPAPPSRRARAVGAGLAGVLLAVGSLSAAAAGSGDVANDAGLQWNLDRIGAEPAWATATGAGTIIAVVDSGVALDHEDLVDQLVPGVACQGTGGDPARCEGSPADDDGHGSHVAGIAAATTGNGLGIAGVAPDARIMPVKVLFRACETCQSTGEADDVSAAVRWAAEQGADVINLSLGSTTSAVFGAGFADAVRDAWALGAIPVVAAGNDYVLTADLDGAPAVVVSATDRDDAAPEYSDGVGDATWALAAPGGDGTDTPESCSQRGEPRGILSTFWSPEDGRSAYACLSGTSMAAPHVSGALAVLRSAGLSPEEAVERLLATAVDLGEPGPDRVFGAGRLDLAAAVAGVAVPASPPTEPPTEAELPAGEPDVAAPPRDELPARDVPLPLALLATGLVVLTGAGTVAAARR